MDTDVKGSIFEGFGLLIPFLIICICFSLLTRGTLLHPDNLVNLIQNFSLQAIIAVGMTMVMITGGIDFSVGALAALAGVGGVWTIGNNLPIVIGILIALLLGAGGGMINGLLVTRANIAPVMVTISVGVLARGLAGVFSSGERSWLQLARNLPFLSVIGIMGAVSTGYLILDRTEFGQRLHIAGEKKRKGIAKIEEKNFVCLAYTICGLLSGAAGMMWVGLKGWADPTGGKFWALSVIAGVLLGDGAQPKDGVAGKNLLGAFIGLLIVCTINNGLGLLNVSKYGQLIALGLILLVAAAMAHFREGV